VHRRFIPILIVIATAMCGGAMVAGETLSVGDEAPAFTLPGSDGKSHSLSDHVGERAVVIAWFPKAFTGG
jgi:peroxiredoxin Q/BCP